MNDQEFLQPYDICEFVFKECADTSYYLFDFSEESKDGTILEHIGYELVINKPMADYRFIYYAEKLLKEKFDMSIESLSINHLDLTENDFQDDWLSKMSGLKKLFCYKNNLKELPKLPKNLKYLSCMDNRLKELPKLPKNLIALFCANNYIETLPELPSTLRHLFLENNPVYSKKMFRELKKSHHLYD